MKIPMHQRSKYYFDVTPKIEYYYAKRANVQKYVEERCCRESQKVFGNSQVSGAGDR